MSGGAERRQSKRVIFEHPVTAQLMAIDGTWRRECSIYDVSDDGAGSRSARRSRDFN
jgi:hypothetical protein